MMPKTSSATSRAVEQNPADIQRDSSATRQAPSVMKKAIDLRRPLTAMWRL